MFCGALFWYLERTVLSTLKVATELPSRPADRRGSVDDMTFAEHDTLLPQGREGIQPHHGAGVSCGLLLPPCHPRPLLTHHSIPSMSAPLAT
jgi:hypothetical protein